MPNFGPIPHPVFSYWLPHTLQASAIAARKEAWLSGQECIKCKREATVRCEAVCRQPLCTEHSSRETNPLAKQGGTLWRNCCNFESVWHWSYRKRQGSPPNPYHATPHGDDLETTVKRRGLTQGWVLLGLFDRK